MNRVNAFLVAAFMSAALLLPNMAQSMEIRQFDKMAQQDQHEYISNLFGGAQKVLIDEGRSDLAAKVQKLFTEIPAGDDIPLGLTEFSRNLDRARLADAKRAAQDPNARRLEVEDAMAVTLKANRIEVPQSFFTVASGFKPKSPPQKK